MSGTMQHTKDTKGILPPGWRWVRLGEVCESRTGIRDPKATPEVSFQYVDIATVDNSRKRIASVQTIQGKNAPSRARQIIRTNDVLVATTRPNLNAVALVPQELDDQICSTGFCVLRANRQAAPDYLFAFVRHAGFVDSLTDLVKGALYPAVNDGQVFSQIIPLPPLPEQRRIAAILKEQMAAVDKARAAAEARLEAVKALPAAVRALCEAASRILLEKQVPPLILWAAQNLDFLCIHPFRDGNGRVSRLLLLLSLYRLGFSGGRFVSLERIIEQSKERYYETLKAGSQGWHQGKHDPWPYINFLLFTLKSLYQEFESRYENTALPLGEKTETVRQAVFRFQEAFHIAELHKQCPEVSLDMVRKVLKTMRQDKEIECLGRGKHARWQRIG